jgi:hypothetical protein
MTRRLFAGGGRAVDVGEDDAVVVTARGNSKDTVVPSPGSLEIRTSPPD